MGYYLSTFSGLGKIAEQELTDEFGKDTFNFMSYETSDLDLLRFDFGGHVTKLADIGTADDLYYFLAEVPLKGSADDLETLSQVVADHSSIPLALAAHKQFRGAKTRLLTKVA